jgi:broad specificity phosphatase PhoE
VTVPRLILVRHGLTDWNREGRFQGHLDPPLSRAGRHEARLVARRLAAIDDLRPARIIASPLQRAFATAVTIGRAVGLEPVPDARLVEIGQGDWEGLTYAEIELAHPDEYRAWRAAGGMRPPPGGEPFEKASARIAEVVADVTRKPPWPACIVSHGGALRLMAHTLLELDRMGDVGLDVDNAAISVVARPDDEWHLERWNDSLHLLGLEPTHVDESEGQPLAL